ncbi:MAG: bacteriohemerythrin [Gemmatimonadaceae bacterium]
MKWNESYATGIPHLDQQHQTLFKAVAAMSAAVATDDGAAEYLRLLGFLDRYCRRHFADEEGCMARYRCPSAKVNRQQHEGLLQMIAEHRRFHAAHGYDPHDASLLVNAMHHWLHCHLGGIDRELWHCVKKPLS